MRTIYLPALGRHVTLAAYLQAVRMAKANPDMTFKTGFTTGDRPPAPKLRSNSVKA